MQKLSLLILFLLSGVFVFAQSPHGAGLKTDCAACHSSGGWKVNMAGITFDHGGTRFGLTGQHRSVSCKGCHPSLKFEEARPECSACHTDMHNQTVGPDCRRCHSPESWIVRDMKGLHQLTRFPLDGKHAIADCAQCHKSATRLQFPPLGVACIDCHRSDYQTTKSPDHLQSNFSVNCIECHGARANGWNATNFEHGFFLLTEGHQIGCAECHTNSTFRKLPTDCAACHQKHYDASTNPNHKSARFSTACAECHTTSPGWNPVTFTQHDAQYFPIYSGSHKGEWNRCSDCHTANQYNTFTCTSCHEHSRGQTDSEHGGINGYSYNSLSCYGCHPQGNKSGTFNHSATGFQLSGGHASLVCSKCHTTTFAGTSPECNACHQKNYVAAVSPNHKSAGIVVDCRICHTTAAWQPSTFRHATTGFELTGAHAALVQCSVCHAGNTTSAKPECISCHLAQYNTAKGHAASGFPTDCKACHSMNNWLGATFNHASTGFALNGAHTSVSCVTCHPAGYKGTSPECKNCHTTDYNNAVNPNHKTLALPMTCADCHTTAPGWQPAAFAIHSTYYVLTGAHQAIAQNCAACHHGNYSATANTCNGCHATNYKNTTNPPHAAAQFPVECATCHSTNAWAPSTFQHDAQYFPIYSGKHNGKWTKCSDCHSTPSNFALFSCIICHEHSSKTATDQDHAKVKGYTYNGTSCYGCHPKGN